MAATVPKPFVFVLMPFDENMSDVYKLGIKAACTEAGAYCERVDEQIFEERMLDRIYNQIAKADLIVADMTGRNPNVFYEVGYAHALGKRVILITQQAADIPFDLKHHYHIVYENRIVALKDQLHSRVGYYLTHSEVPTSKRDPIVTLGEAQLEAGKRKEIVLSRGEVLHNLRFLLHNPPDALEPIPEFLPTLIIPPDIECNVEIRSPLHKFELGGGATVIRPRERLDIPPGGWEVFSPQIAPKGENWPILTGDFILRLLRDGPVSDFIFQLRLVEPTNE